MARRRTALVLLAFLAAGSKACIWGVPRLRHASAPPFTPSEVPSGKAMVVFFRENKTAGSARSIGMSIPLSLSNCFDMQSGGYFRHVMAPGDLKVRAEVALTATNRPRGEFSIHTSADETRYVQVEQTDDGPTFTELPASDAAKVLEDTREIDRCKKK